MIIVGSTFPRPFLKNSRSPNEDPETGKPISVKTEQYIKAVTELLENIPLGKLKIYWWQQDGATSHTSKTALAFLKKIFGNRD